MIGCPWEFDGREATSRGVVTIGKVLCLCASRSTHPALYVPIRQDAIDRAYLPELVCFPCTVNIGESGGKVVPVTEPEYDVVVLGLGAMGSAAAYHLSKRG